MGSLSIIYQHCLNFSSFELPLAPLIRSKYHPKCPNLEIHD